MDTAQDRLKREAPNLTRAERQLADAILDNYPMSGLGTITMLAERAGVSSPTVARMVQKLGYSGFPDFQAALRAELEARMSGPVAKRDGMVGAAPETHILNRFTGAVIENVRQTFAALDLGEFDRVTRLIADEKRAVFVAGGRITHALSEYLHLHLQVIRPRVRHIRTTTNAWPHDLLDLATGDVVLIYDIRRYENSTLKLAEAAAARGAVIVLVTDQWRSPVAKLAEVTLAGRIEAPSAWDSTVALMLLSETLVAAVQEASWDRTRARMDALEEMFDATRIFRKFV